MPSAQAGRDIAESLVQLQVREDALAVSHGDTVLVTGRDGWLLTGPERGLFVRQTRVLDRLRVHLGGRLPMLASQSALRQDRWLGYYLIRAPGTASREEAGKLQAAVQQAVELRVSRTVGDGMHEDLDLTNHTRCPVRVRLALEFSGDFADLDETKDGRQQRGTLHRAWKRRDGGWARVTRYRARRAFDHDGERGVARLDRGLVAHFRTDDEPAVRRGDRISFDVDLPPHGRWHLCIDWIATEDGEELPVPCCEALSSREGATDRRDAPFLAEATHFSTGESRTLAPVVAETLERARHDLAGLRLHRLDRGPRAWTVAAGVPMFIAFFGRDSLLASTAAATLGPELLRGTLPLLGETQGTEDNPWRDERPGRILHEAHRGPLAALNLIPRARHYGSLSSPSLYALAVAQLWAWTGDRAAVEPLLAPALAALAWLDREACATGFYAYTTKSKKGIGNQTWKDSEDGLVDEQGDPLEQPAAACEEQGTVYAAKRALARVLSDLGRAREARRLHDEAADLARRFDASYWCDATRFYAIALDVDGRAVPTIASNALHALSTGIAPPSRHARLAERMFADDLFSGWGIRTLSTANPGFNPYAYHRGCVWPVEHGPLALGLRRAGRFDELERLCRAMFEATAVFAHRRLPECFNGHARGDDHPFPALYPPANAPQAWSATTPLQLMQALLGLEAFAPQGVLCVDPRLPAWLPELRLHGLRVGDARVDLHCRRTAGGATELVEATVRGRLRVLRRTVDWATLHDDTDTFDERLTA